MANVGKIAGQRPRDAVVRAKYEAAQEAARRLVRREPGRVTVGGMPDGSERPLAFDLVTLAAALAPAEPEQPQDPRDHWAKALKLVAADRGVTDLRKGPLNTIVATFPPGSSLADIAEFEMAIEDTLHGVSFPVISSEAPVVQGRELPAL